jgi:hypothetical protein
VEGRGFLEKVAEMEMEAEEGTVEALGSLTFAPEEGEEIADFSDIDKGIEGEDQRGGDGL